MARLSLCALALLLCVQSVFGIANASGGIITCESLNPNSCAFAVSSSGTRCVLEKQVGRGPARFLCRPSAIQVSGIRGLVETEECLQACGLTRNTVGISSDSLPEARFTQKLCSPRCYRGCPNIVDLYFNLAAGEGLFLPSLCEAEQRSSTRRRMAEIRSSSLLAAAGPESGSLASAPTWSLLASAPTQSLEPVLASGSAMSPL